MKQKIIRFLEWRTSKYLNKKHPIVVAITGSIGKTSTTQAIATVLGEKYHVKATKYNYNTDIGAIMSIFDLTIQTHPIKWALLCIEVVIKSFGRPPKDQLYVLELGSDAPGQIAPFSYLMPALSIVTAVQPEHMEFFKTMDAVAKEELLVTHFSQKSFANSELIEVDYLTKYARTDTLTFGPGTGYYAEETSEGTTFVLGESLVRGTSLQLIGRSGRAILLAAAIAGKEMGLSDEQLAAGLAKVAPEPGRMSQLRGIMNSRLIDDTYNASPEAYDSAIEYLYSQNAPQRMLILGMMNELGDDTERFHRQVGQMCDPTKLDLVVTLGTDASTFSFDEATKRGCRVLKATSPVEAARIVKENLKDGAIVEIKGSQNGVYLEEAVKRLLADPSDASKLTRQHDYWPAKKAKQFPDLLTD